MRLLALVLALSLAFVADTAAIQSQVRSREAIIGGIRNGEISAVVEAEQSGDRTLVPIIVAESYSRWWGMPGTPTRDSPFVIAARHAIAALADRRQLQEIWCEAVDENDINPQVSPLGLVGGWFGIRGLQELLKPERQSNWERAMRRRPKGDIDVSHLSPRTLSLMELADVLPESPVSMEAAATAGLSAPLLVEKLNDWINLHKAELEKRAPTGEGVDYSARACKGGKPVKW